METEPKIETSQKPEVKKLKKEDFSFSVDENGIPIPRPFEVEVFDVVIDTELRQENEVILTFMNKQDSYKNLIRDARITKDKIVEEMKEKMTKEEKSQEEIDKAVANLKGQIDASELKYNSDLDFLARSLKDCRQNVKDLKEIKAKNTEKYLVEAIPLNNAEMSRMVKNENGGDSKGLAPDGKETTDWVSSLISFTVKDPSYTFEEAERLQPNLRIALKNLVYKISGYNPPDYRQIIQEKRMSEKKEPTSEIN